MEGKPCDRCGTTEKISNGWERNGTRRWTCKACKRGKDQRPGGHRSLEVDRPVLVAAECRCGDRIGDNPWCVLHEDSLTAV